MLQSRRESNVMFLETGKIWATVQNSFLQHANVLVEKKLEDTLELISLKLYGENLATWRSILKLWGELEDVLERVVHAI